MRQIAVSCLLFWLAGARLLAVDSVVVFNEINYHPATNEAAQEWIELHNQMAVDIDLSAWSISGDVDYTFAEGTIIRGGGYLVIASDPVALRGTTLATNILGPFSGRLNNSTGNLELRDRNDRLMDEMEYRDRGKWPVAADGSGATLAKPNPDATSGPPENWSSSILARGTPGERNFPAPPRARYSALVPFNALWRYESSGTDLGTTWREPSFDDTAWSGRNNATLVSYWPFNGNATATHGTSGTFVNAVGTTADRNGVAGGALAFNGVNTYVSVTGGGGLNSAAAGTISMWVKWSGVQDADCCGTFGAVLARQGNGLFSDNIIALNNSSPTAARVVWRQSGGPAPTLITGTSIVGTNWHHIVVTFANSGSTLYIDGAAQGTAVGAGMNNNSGVPLSIGAWAGDGAGFAGASIDDVAIWDQSLSASQVADLAAQAKTPLDFSTPESAVYFAGDGRLTTNDDLRRTALPLGPNTYYFRNKFILNDDPAQTQLNLDLALDDGAVFYLNGVEIYRHNMPGGPINYSTFAATVIGDVTIVNGIGLLSSQLVRGTNVFAVELHQAVVSDGGMVFGAGLSAVVTPSPVVETVPLVGLHDIWRYDAADTDLGGSWRDAAYNDAGWLSGAAVLYAGSGTIDGLPPEKIGPITATASTQYTPDGRLAINAVNGAGLVGNAHGNAPNTMWLNNGTFAAPNDLNPFIIFDLGVAQAVRSMKVWNYNEFLPGRPDLLARGTSRADVLAGSATNALSMLFPGQMFTQAPGTQTDFSQTVDLGNINARYVKFERLTNFPGGDNNFVGLSEVQFFRDADLRRTELPLGTVTYYFRKNFQFAGDPARASLLLNAVIDDGAVTYLNGTEIHRFNMPDDDISHQSLAANAVANPVFSGPILLPASALLHGANVLAVEVHQASAMDDTDMIFGLELSARIAPRDPSEFAAGNLLFSEISEAGTTGFQVELVNRGSTPIDVSGYVIRRTGPSPDAEHVLAPSSVAPGEFLVLSQAVLGFAAQTGDKLFLLRPGRTAIADAVEVHERPRARPFDGVNDWLTPNIVTLGASNSFSLRDEIVINEIMYHAPPTLELPAVVGTNFFVTITNVWKYDDSGTDLGTAWRSGDYDDSTWPSGPALLYNTTVNLPAPRNTLLALGPTTYYFRTTFVYTGAPLVLSLTNRHIVDDGVIIYLNGNEVHRFNLPFGPITYTNFASAAILNGTYRSPVGINLTNLVLGTNVLAAEVHQFSTSGNDVAFGAELWARVETVPRVPFSESNEGWIELLNRGSNAVNLTGWRIDEGIDYRFPSNTMIAPGGYLVVAKDPAPLLANFPGIDVLGPYTNALSHRGERIVLKDAADNPADRVHYFDDGRWPRAADGRGSSLELRDPRADHSAGEAWAASDETARSSWRTYTYRGFAGTSPVGPDGQWREFVIGLLAAGEVLLDDISVTTNGVQILQNGAFTSGLNAWRFIGNHHGEVIDDSDQPGNKVLRLVATGSTEHMSNHGETTLIGNGDIVVGREYVISFRAKWINGSRQLNTRLYFNRVVRTTLLDAPTTRGTPGTQNTAFTSNIGPTYSSLRHDPPVPAPFAPVTVSVRADDPDGVASLTLWSAVDGASPWSSSPMTLSSDGSYAGIIPGKAAGAKVQFLVEAIDQLGVVSAFPAEGTNSRALYQVDDGSAATNGLHNVRLIALTRDSDELFRTINLMSNERIGCTVIYDERDIFYNAALRLKGSEHSRTTTPRLGFNVAFTSEQRLRGVHDTVAIDRSESTGFGQREMLIHQTLNHAGGLPTKYNDLIHVMAPRTEYTGSAELQLARFTDVFLDDQFNNGSEGTVFEYELVYQLNSTDTGTPEGYKIPAPDNVVGTLIRNLGDDKEGYRWTFLIKNNEEKDDYSRIMLFAKAMELTGPNFNAQMTNLVDIDLWLRGTAANALSGAGDSYGGDGSQHNVQFYIRPSDGKLVYLPHDVDAFFNATRAIVPNNDTAKIIAVPAWARAYYCHLLDIIATTYNADYMTRWANHFGELLPAQNFAAHLAFLVQRANFVTSQVNAAVPNPAFAITSNSGNNFGTTNNTISLTGNAGLSIKSIEVNGVAYPINWLSVTTWSIPLSLFAGANSITVQGVNAAGVRLTNALDAITITNTGSGAPLPVVINEWMADNDGPAGFADSVDGQFEDWLELYNPNTNALNIGGFFLTDDLSVPTKWQIPTPTLIQPRGFLLVWADNEPQQNAMDTNGNLHAAFQLSRNGESIRLLTSGGVPQHTITFGEQYLNVSQGLFPDGSTNVHYMTNWTPHASNTLTTSLRFTEVSVAAGIVTLTWASTPGVGYRVYYKNRLEDADWIVLGATVFAVGQTVSATDTPPGSYRFYRIALADE